MGDSFKKWMAGITAALIVIIIAAIALGRMERNAASGVSAPTSRMAAKASPPASVAHPSENPETNSQKVGVANEKSAAMRNEAGASMGAKKAADRSAVHIRGGQVRAAPSQAGNQSSAQSSALASQTSAQPIAQANLKGAPGQQAQVQPQMPSSAPDTATTQAQATQTVTSVSMSSQENERRGLLKTTGRVNLNGVYTPTSSLVYENDHLGTPGLNGALLTGTGNAIALGYNAQFTAQLNQFLLDAGQSNVNTNTGMSTVVKDYTITPVDPNRETHYEVNWEDDGIYVYARTNDVEIKAPCRRWRVKEGDAIKISDPRKCGILWLGQQPGHWPYAVVGGAAAAGTGVLIWLATHEQPSTISSQAP